jgi:hypothetical protein
MIQEAKDQDERDLTEEEATRRETPGPEYAAARMRWVGTRAERALRQEAEARSDRDRVAILLPAAREVHSAVSDLLINSEVWAPLGDAAAGLQALDDRQMRDIQQVFDQDLAALLSYLGYRPRPPPPHQ